MDLGYNFVRRCIQREPARIPRPANAFMLYANQNRKRMSHMYPLDSNKEISKRLGNSWKELDSTEKLRYYELAKQVDTEHKRKYPDYVYNPKEARIRKAMREASRERALGVASMSSPRTPSVRRPTQTAPPATAWNFASEDQLMMAPTSHGIRTDIIGSPMCTTSGFPPSMQPTNAGAGGGGGGGNGPFATMQSMHFSKQQHMQHRITHSTGSYMQPLTQQAELWQPYEDTVRTPSGPYMLPPQMSYPQSLPPPHSPAVLPPPTQTPSQMDKPKVEPDTFNHVDDSQSSHTNENIPPNGEMDKMPLNDAVYENKVEGMQPLVDSGNMHNAEPFMPTYGDNILSQTSSYEKNETIKLKKSTNTSTQHPPSRHHFHGKPSRKPLPDFNEAFGSTERGRFQRPPNNKGYLDYFLPDNNDIQKFMEFQ